MVYKNTQTSSFGITKNANPFSDWIDMTDDEKNAAKTAKMKKDNAKLAKIDLEIQNKKELIEKYKKEIEGLENYLEDNQQTVFGSEKNETNQEIKNWYTKINGIKKQIKPLEQKKEMIEKYFGMPISMLSAYRNFRKHELNNVKSKKELVH